MKLAALATLFVPGMAFAAWTTTDFPAFTEEGTGRFISQKVVEKGTRPLQLNFDQQCWQPSGGIKLNQMLSMEPCRGTPPQWRIFRQGLYTLEVDTRSGTPTMMISLEEKEASAAAPADPSVSEVGWKTADHRRQQNLRRGQQGPRFLQRQCRDRQRRQNHPAARLRQQWPAAARACRDRRPGAV